MWKENKKIIILTSFVILLPMILGFLLWNQLPDRMATHWNVAGMADGGGSKLFAITVPYLVILVCHWFCLYFTIKDPWNQNQNKKAMSILYWIMPMVAVFAACLIYSTAFGWKPEPGMATIPLMGVMFLLFGNYMPKIKQNMTFGIKLPWTMRNEENWNKTHRLGGKVWVAGGFLMIIDMFFPTEIMVWIIVLDIAATALIPTVYSYLLYRKQKANGDWSMEGKLTGNPMYDRYKRYGWILTVGIFIFVGVMLFTGNIKYQYEDTSFTIESSYWPDLTLDYDRIESITYRDDLKGGTRTNGFGSPRLAMGTFTNDEFGNYTRYTYTKNKEVIVLETERSIFVINGKDSAETKAIYEELNLRIKEE